MTLRPLFWFIVAVHTIIAASPSSFIYREINRNVSSEARFSIHPDGTGFWILDSSSNSEGAVIQEFRCDSAYATRSWRYRCGTGTDMLFTRTGGTIVLSGRLRGKPVDRNLTIDTMRWFQLIPPGLESALRHSARLSSFWAISLSKPAMLKPVRFCVMAVDTASFPGRTDSACFRVRLKIDGLLASVWRGDYFFRLHDRSFIVYQGFSFGSKSPSGTITVMNRE